MLCDSPDVVVHMHYIYSQPPDTSPATMSTLLKRLIARWRNRKEKQSFMHSRWGDMSITAPTDGSWNDMSPRQAPTQFGDEFLTGYIPDLSIGEQRADDMDSPPMEPEKSKTRCLLERLSLRSPEPEQPNQPMSKTHNTFTRHSRSDKSSSTGSRRKVVYTPINREDLEIISHSQPEEIEKDEMTTPTAGNGPSEHSDDDSIICPTVISETSSVDTFPNIITRSIDPEEAANCHHSYDGMDRIYDGTFEPRQLPLSQETMSTQSSPGVTSTAYTRSSSGNKCSSMEAAATSTSASTRSSSPGLAATAYMRSSSWRRRRHCSDETAATSAMSSPSITSQSREMEKKKRKSKLEKTEKKELVPSLEELFG